MVDTILRTIGGVFLPPGALDRDPRQTAGRYIPPGLLNDMDDETQAAYGQFIQSQINKIGAHRRPNPAQLQDTLMSSINASRAQQQQQQMQGQLGSIFSPGAGGAMPGAPAAPASPGMSAAPDPNIAQAINTAASRYGVNADAMMMIASLESGFNPLAQNPNSSAAGLFQFIDATADQYNLQNRYDPAESADAAARLMRDNTQVLSRALGREPTPAELYLAHQQGATGASRLLQNPDKRAVDVVGRNQVLLNGGDENMTAGEFANMWMSRATGGMPQEQAAPQAQGGTRSQLESRAEQYFQAADMFAQQGNIELAQRYHSIGLDLLKETPGGQIVTGADLGLDPNQTYFVDQNGKPTPLGPVAGENAGVINTIHSTFQTISRDNREQLTAAERALTSLESTNDFATAQAILTWLTAIGARPRVGADGNYITESGIGAEFARIVNLIQGGGQLTEQQRKDLSTQISQARQPIQERQKGLNDVLKAQLQDLRVPSPVIDSMIRSIEGGGAETVAMAPPPPPAAAPAAAPAPGEPVTITSDDEYNQLPSGTVFVGPDGVTRRKP